MSALDSGHTYGFALLQSIGIGDLDGDRVTAQGYIPNGVFWANSPFGFKLFKYIQNRHTATVTQGALVSALGDVNMATAVTTSGTAAQNTKVKATTTGLTANAHQGAIVYVQNSVAAAGAAPEGEESIVAGNTATEIYVEPGNAFSATLSSGDTLNLIGSYNSDLSAAGDLAYGVQGVVVGKNGISAGNFGFVQVQGRCQSALVKAATGFTAGGVLIADVGRIGPASTSPANVHIGTVPNTVVSDIVSDRTTVILTLGPGFNPGAAAA